MCKPLVPQAAGRLLIALLTLAGTTCASLADTSATRRASHDRAAKSDPIPLERLALGYRIHVYHTFHADRAEFQRRRDAWRRLEQQWRDRGSPPRQEPLLREWLVAAIRASRAGATGPLPPEPRLGTREDALPAPVVQTTEADRVRPEPVTPTIRPPTRHQTRPRHPATVVNDPPGPAPAASPPLAQPASVRPVVRVNVDELRARIIGHNLAVTDLAEQLRENRPWSAGRLAPLVEEAAELSYQRRVLEAYVALVSTGERSGLDAVTPGDESISLLARHIAARRLELTDGRSPGPAGEVELAQLADLSRQLAEASAR